MMVDAEKTKYETTDGSALFDMDLVDALGVGPNWHQISPGTLEFVWEETEEVWWAHAELIPNLQVQDTPTHDVWFPLYEISGYRVAQQ